MHDGDGHSRSDCLDVLGILGESIARYLLAWQRCYPEVELNSAVIEELCSDLLSSPR